MAAKKKADTPEIKVTLIRSTIGSVKAQKDTVAALGLKKINQSKVHRETAAIKGMLTKVAHLVKVESI